MKKQRIRKNALWAWGLAAAVFLIVVFASQAQATWVEPTLSPPYGNIAAPLNDSDLNQTKIGGLEIRGGLTVSTSNPEAPVTILGTAADAVAGTTIGVQGIGGAVTNPLGTSAGVYGSTTASPDAGSHYGVVGVAASDASNFYGVGAWDGDQPSAYAGYFRGSSLFQGPITVATNQSSGYRGSVSADSFCLLGTCITTWLNMSTESAILKESPANHTFFSNVNSSLTVGGQTDSDSAFLFHVASTDDTSLFYTPGSVILGQPASVTANDGICQTGETCSSGNHDCWGQQDSCDPGYLCDPAGSGSCILNDTDPPVGGFAQIPDATPTTIVLRRGVADDLKSGVKDYHFFLKEGSYTTDPADYLDLGYQETPDYEVISDVVGPSTEYSFAVSARDYSNNEQTFANSPHVSATTPPDSCNTNDDCAGSTRTFCCANVCQLYCGNGGGGSPAILKGQQGEGSGNLLCQPGQPGYPQCLMLESVPNQTIARSTSKPQTLSFLERVQKSASSAVHWVTSQFTRSLDSFQAPLVHAAGTFGGTMPARLTINNGVIHIVNADGSTVMELGNAGTDIASSGNIYLRPNTTTQGSYFAGSGSTQDLHLTGSLIAGSGQITSNGPTATLTVTNNAGTTPIAARFDGAVQTTSRGKFNQNGLSVIALTSIPTGNLTTCTTACSNAGQTCLFAEDKATATAVFAGCGANGNQFPSGTNCLCY